MAKTKNPNFPPFDYSNTENHPTLISLFKKLKLDITVEEAIEAHKTLFSDPTNPPTEEDIKKYFNI
jgi:hypothetical protein